MKIKHRRTDVCFTTIYNSIKNLIEKLFCKNNTICAFCSRQQSEAKHNMLVGG